MVKIRNHLFYFILFFTLFYIEILSIGGVKIAVIWKLPFVVFMIVYIFLDKIENNTKKFVFWGYLYSFKNFFSLSSFSNIIPSLTEVTKSIYIVLIFHFLITLKKNRNIDLYKIVFYLSLYIILSCVPFLLNLIKPLGNGYDLSIFGLEATGFVGIFQVASSAAVTISFAIIVLIYHLTNEELNRNQKILLLLVILLGIWVEIQTYARTGFAILFVAGSYLIFYKKSFSFYLRLIIPMAVIVFGVISYYNSSKAFQMRISGTNMYLQKSNTETDGGSGRLKFASHAIDNWSESGIAGQWLGLGTELAKDMMKEDVGLRIYAHNGFVDVLQFNGLIGTLIFILFIFYLIRFILTNRSHKYYKLNLSILFGYIISMLLQGEHYFLADFIFALTLSLLYQSEKSTKENNA